MLFNSWEFAIFLVVVFFLYWFAFNNRLQIQNAFILFASYVFYCYWDIRYLILIVFTSFCSWFTGIYIEKYIIQKKAHIAKIFCSINIIINLLILAVFKYYNFFVSEFIYILYGAGAESWIIDILLPVGISFYTFQALSYSIDIYRRQIKATRSIIQFFAYVAFFPQLVAGPIERATNLLTQFEKERTFDYKEATDGLRQMLWGFFKKMIIADNCGKIVDSVWANYGNENGSTLLLGAVMFSFQIYGDFSGYSDIAIGTSKLFGIRLCKNFNLPYFSRDIAEFWRRWHISLNTWFRDYLYIPLGGSKGSTWKRIRNTFVIFSVSGLWHGANWTFIFWGIYHAMLFLPMLLLKKNRKHLDIVAINAALPSLRELWDIALTFSLTTIGWIIFRAPTINDAYFFIKRIFFSGTLFTMPNHALQGNGLIIYFALISMIIIEWTSRRDNYAFEKTPCKIKYRFARWLFYITTAFFILQYNGTSEKFIYFQF